MKIEVGKHYLYKRTVAINDAKKEVGELVKVIEKVDGVTSAVLLRTGHVIDVENSYLHEADCSESKPAHYDTAIDTIAFAKANFTPEQVEGFMRINAIKYLQRDKGQKLSDLKKARHYIDMLIEMEEGK